MGYATRVHEQDHALLARASCARSLAQRSDGLVKIEARFQARIVKAPPTDVMLEFALGISRCWGHEHA